MKYANYNVTFKDSRLKVGVNVEMCDEKRHIKLRLSRPTPNRTQIWFTDNLFSYN